MNKLLTKKFFRDNPYKEISAPHIIYVALRVDGFEEKAQRVAIDHIDVFRKEKIREEERLIESEDSPEAIFKLFRKGVDVINRSCLINKALQYESILLPLVVEKLIRSDHDTFIENAIRLLAKSKEDRTMALMEKYEEIRSPYVRSLACLLLGLRGGEEIIPWIYSQYFEMKQHYPDESYDQGPLLALYELSERFYESAQRSELAD